MTGRIEKYLDTSSPSICHWNELLNFVRETPDLTLEELRQLAEASERYRQHWNTEEITTETIIKNGQEVTTPKTRNSLEIRREDVRPNIHQKIHRLEKQRREAIKPKQHNIESMPQVAAV